MSKQKTLQRYVYKIESKDIRNSKWDYNFELSFIDGIKEKKIITIGDSQLLRFIDEINGCRNNQQKAIDIRVEIELLKRQGNSVQNRHKISKLYSELYNIQVVPEYLCVIMNTTSDYRKLNKGFKFNGEEYRRLVSTPGGIKESTIIYTKASIFPALQEKIENGRDLNKKLVPAKLEAYRSLVCSTSTPVSTPKGILVVNDCETNFVEDVLYIQYKDSDEPIISEKNNYKIKLNASDGFGLASPEIMQRWSTELGEKYTCGGVCVRNAFVKGMVFGFDFHKFARDVACKEIVEDVWGNRININDVELVLTTSMLKLWDGYNSIEHYLSCCEKNGFTFSITKTVEHELDNEKRTNYQFLQTLHMSDEDIIQLLLPTVNEIKDVLQEDPYKAILYLCGKGLDKNNFFSKKEDWVKCLMVAPKLLEDSFVRSKIKQMIKKRMNELKFGRIPVHSNFTILSGDPYALCQSIFGIKVTGLLKAHEYYSSYWNSCGVKKVAGFRAPMSCHANIRILNLIKNDDTELWYQHMKNITILNAWDTTTQALNGADYDGDLIFTTDNSIILNSISEEKTIICEQNQSIKTIPTEKEIIESNIKTFGNKIGSITNKITEMVDIQSKFGKGSQEYETLEYRIRCGQMLQQNEIDKAKGIVTKPMPKLWYDKKSISDNDIFNESIMANKRPYFMVYTNPTYMKEYKKYFTNKNRNAKWRFGKYLEELSLADCVSEEEREYLFNYNKYNPISNDNGTMNRICRCAETLLSNIQTEYNEKEKFDASILKCGATYPKSSYYSVRTECNNFWEDVKSIMADKDCENRGEEINMLQEAYKQKLYALISNELELCDIMIDLSYSTNKAKMLTWFVCGATILKNLLSKNNNTCHFPIKDKMGDLFFGGNRFSLCEVICAD